MDMDLVQHHFNKLDSTNNCAKRNAHLLDPKKLTLISTSEQLSGRGRAGRIWSSPKNQNIYATFCFFVDQKRGDLGNLSQVMAISVVQLLRNYGTSPVLKWPNDLQVNQKKIGGILSEIVSVNSSHCFLCGIGLNVNMTGKDLMKLSNHATSLLVESNKSHDPEALLKELKDIFYNNLTLFLDKGFTPFCDTLKTLMSHSLHQEIRFHDHTKILNGILDSINDDGSVTLLLANNQKKRFSAGEILDEH